MQAVSNQASKTPSEIVTPRATACGVVFWDANFIVRPRAVGGHSRLRSGRSLLHLMPCEPAGDAFRAVIPPSVLSGYVSPSAGLSFPAHQELRSRCPSCLHSSIKEDRAWGHRPLGDMATEAGGFRVRLVEGILFSTLETAEGSCPISRKLEGSHHSSPNQ